MYTNPVPESFDRRKNNAPLLYICNFIGSSSLLWQPNMQNAFIYGLCQFI